MRSEVEASLDAAASGNVALARALIEADPGCLNERSPSGNTPLHELVHEYDAASELITLLLANGADPRALNDAGQTPAQRLEALGLDEIADVLEASA
jgi:ankyrin repeat protein